MQLTEGERLKEIRKQNGLTLEAFGARLGVGKQAISKLEKNENKITSQMKKLICREFNVNYDWLEYGTGEMYSDLPKTILGDLCLAYGCDKEDEKLVQAYLESDPDMRAVIKQFLRNLSKKM